MMNETLALFSYGWTRYQKLAWVVLAVTIVAFSLSGLAHVLGLPEIVSLTLVQLGMLGVLGCIGVPVVMFGMCKNGNALASVGSYDPWLLRLPIPSWKLAVIPALLITASVTALWVMLAVPIRIWSGEQVPIFSQILSMSSLAIFLYAFVWKPPRYPWLQVVVAIAASPFAFLVAFGSIGVAGNAPEMMPLVLVGSTIGYVASIAFAIYSVRLARVSSYQQSSKLKAVSPSQSLCEVPPIRHQSRVAALAWYDARRFRVQRVCLFAGLALVTIFCASVLPLTGGTAIFGLVFAGVMCWACTSTFVEPSVYGVNSSLPSYLIASPLSSREIAYGRLKSISVAFVLLFFLMSLSLLCSLLWKSNLVTVERWWASISDSLSASAPIRIILFAYLATLGVTLGLLLRMTCVQLYGRQSVAAWVTGSIVFALAAPFIVVLVWFLKQTNWEEVTLVATSWLNWSYNLIYVALATKLCVDLFIIWRTEKRLVSQREITQFTVGWSVLVMGAAVTAWMLWPAASFTLTTAFMVAAVVIPLSPVLLAPRAVDANRHRSV